MIPNTDLNSEFNLFLEKWGNQLKDASFILDIMNSYPPVLSKLQFEDVLTSNEIINSQKDWVRICSKYKDLEKEFFKPYWVPIQKSSLDYFIDLSDKNYPLFKISFIFFEPYSYQRINLFNSINDLLTLGDSDVNIESIAKDFKDKWFEFYCQTIYSKK